MATGKKPKGKGKSKATAKGKKSHLQVVKGVVPHDGQEAYADLRTKVLGLRESIDKSRWEMAECMFKIHDESIYQHWGYNSYDQWVSVEMGMTVRTAQYLTAIYNWFMNEIGEKLSSADRNKMIDGIRKLGWTKARCLVGVTNKDNVHDWIKKAEGMSSTELESEAKRELAKIQGHDPGAVDNMTNMSFRVADEQRTIVENALSVAENIADSNKKGHLLSLICQDFVASNMAKKGAPEKARGKYLDRIGAQFGVSVVAVDKETGKVVHGATTLKKIKK